MTVGFGLVAGCTENEPIRVYEVPKQETIQVPLGDVQVADDTPFAPESSEPTHRLLGAMVVADEKGLFFKTIAPLDDFSPGIDAELSKLLTSVSFDESNGPRWQLPEGWVEEQGSGMRKANLRIGKLEFSVTELGVPAGDPRSYILDNVNRWRRQIRLAPLDTVGLSKSVKKLTTADGRQVSVVDAEGRLDASSLPPRSRMQNADSTAPPTVPSTVAPPATPPRPAGLTYKTPTGWEELPAGGFRKAAFRVVDGEQAAEVTVIPLGGAAGGLLSNVNRWRGEVGLEPVSEESDIETQKVEIAGKPADYVRLEGDDQATLAAILPVDGSVWFFKLKGNRGLVDREASAFRDFLASFSFGQ